MITKEWLNQIKNTLACNGMVEGKVAGNITDEGVLYVISEYEKLLSSYQSHPGRLICHAPGDRCLNCDHYKGKASLCKYAE